MSKRKGHRTRDATRTQTTVQTRDASSYQILFMQSDGTLNLSGYTQLSECPEITAAVNRIASLIGSMTIRLMRNGENGDIRVKNQLSRMLDIYPNPYMNRMGFVMWIVKTMLLTGSGNAVVVPRTDGGYLRSLEPVSPSRVTFIPNPDGFGYSIRIGDTEYRPDQLLHFAMNPDSTYPWKGTGYTVQLTDIADALKQANKTRNAYLSKEYKPGVIIRVESWDERLQTDDGRAKFLKSIGADIEGNLPVILPADGMQIEQIKPLTLTDLAINDAVNISKQTAAAILGVPPFVLGVGTYTSAEWNNFVATSIMPIAKIIEQELTRKLIYEPTWFVKFNPWSIYAYEPATLASIGGTLYDKGMMTGNEIRDWIGLPPMDGLDTLKILENYIPIDQIANQSKLVGGEDDGDTQTGVPDIDPNADQAESTGDGATA